jgi:hypothetical protein
MLSVAKRLPDRRADHPNDREKIEFHFRNDLPVRSDFQMFTSCIGAFRVVYTVDLRILLGQFPHNFHFSTPFPAMAKPRPFRASDFTVRAKERIAAETRAAHDLGSSWPEIATRYGISEKTARSLFAAEFTCIVDGAQVPAGNAKVPVLSTAVALELSVEVAPTRSPFERAESFPLLGSVLSKEGGITAESTCEGLTSGSGPWARRI